MNRKYNDSQIIELHSRGLTDKEIAEILQVSTNSLAKKRKRLGLSPNKSDRDTYQLNSTELSILVGTLLGDSTIRFVHSQCKYPNLTFTHGESQKEYFDWIRTQLKVLNSSVNIYDSAYTRVSGEIARRWVFTGKNMKCLDELYQIFYPEGKKVIPVKYLENTFTELSLYCLFMDDGSYDIHTNSFIINTQCFSKEDLEEFCQFLKRKFNLSFNIKTDHCLYLKHESNELLRDILARNNKCNSMNYKYDSCHKTPLNRESYVDNPVLNPQETDENAERLEVMPNE